MYRSTKQCTAGLAVGGCTEGVRRYVRIDGVRRVNSRCTAVYGRCTAGCTAGLSVSAPVSIRYILSDIRRQRSGWCFMARTGSPMAEGHGYHLFSCHETAPTRLAQVFPVLLAEDRKPVPARLCLRSVRQVCTLLYLRYRKVHNRSVP